jgi:16S rRNA (adenine1518-N6/adenine1519-N6)-dimethyltransferase
MKRNNKEIKTHILDYHKPRKKKFLGQHFLRKQSVVDNMISKVNVTPQTSVMEVGCGDGFLTRSILEQTKCKKLLVYEIDKEWVDFLGRSIKDDRLTINHENFLDVDLQELEASGPCVFLANLPYNITFPAIFKLQKSKHLFKEGVFMIQEEVAQKLVATRGKGYSATSLFLRNHFDFELLEKVEPAAFNPPPKVFSRLVYFKPKDSEQKIDEEEKFWKFVRLCFKFPRQMLRNNLKSTDYDISKLSDDLLKLRSQQLSFKDFIEIWNVVRD